MTFLFWFLLALIIYCYFGYPLALFVLASFRSRPVNKSNFVPTVSVIISVCNEEDVIAEKIKNLLILEYPADKMEILIGSDGSADRTNEIIKGFHDERIHLFENKERRGKIATVNSLVPKSRNAVLVFTDARQTFAKNAISELVSNFADPDVGCVSGELVFGGHQGATARGIGLYWDYEKMIRSLESQIHSMIGATGAIYAIRRELFSPPPDNVVLDDVFVPLAIVQKGYRAIFDGHARAYDKPADNPREEYSRKARTLYGNYQIFTLFPAMFNPLKSPLAIQIFSHKLLRVMIPFFMAALFGINLLLLADPFFKFVFFLQVLFYGMALVGGLARNKKQGIFKPIVKICYIPYVFCLLNFSALTGFFRFIRANQDVTWEKARTK